MTHVSETTVRYNCNCATSFLSAQNVARDVGKSAVDDRPARVLQVSAVVGDSAPMSPGAVAGVAPWSSPTPVDDYELAADAEVCWLLRHAAVATPTMPEIEPAIGGLEIGGDEAPLVACVAPDFDHLPPHLATTPASWCGLRPPSGAAVSQRDKRRRPCLNFDKMQRKTTFGVRSRKLTKKPRRLKLSDKRGNELRGAPIGSR